MGTIDKNRPICDTDIWIKNCKCKDLFRVDLIFSKYHGVYMSDAVRQELSRTNREICKEEFELGNREVKEFCKNKLVKIIKHESEFFTKEENAAVQREFIDKGILYDYETNKFLGCKSGLGETVTIIYAAMLEIPIILSDDYHCRTGLNLIKEQYPYIDVINLVELLNESKSIKNKDQVSILINKSISEVKDKKIYENSFKKFGKKKAV